MLLLCKKQLFCCTDITLSFSNLQPIAMNTIHDQLKARRKALGLKQEDMMLKAGMARQQYQRLEAGGNPRLDTLELVAKGLKMEVMLIPQEKLQAVRNLLNSTTNTPTGVDEMAESPSSSATDNPWKGLLEDES